MLYKEQLHGKQPVQGIDPDAEPSIDAQSDDSRFQIWIVCLLVVVLLLTIVVAPAAVSANDGLSARGFYAGIETGQSSFFTETDVCTRLIEEITEEVIDNDPNDRATLNDIINGTRCSEDDSDILLSVFAGYQFNKIVAVEAGFTSFGEAKARFVTEASNDRGSVSATGTGSAKANGLSVSALLSTPVDRRFSVYGKIGVLAWDADSKLSATGTGTDNTSTADTDSASITRNDSGADVLFGVGARYRVTDTVGVRLAWTHYEVIEVDTVSLGLEMRF